MCMRVVSTHAQQSGQDASRESVRLDAGPACQVVDISDDGPLGLDHEACPHLARKRKHQYRHPDPPKPAEESGSMPVTLDR